MDLIEAVHQQQASPQLRAYAIYFYYFYGFKKAKIAGLFHKSKTTISTLINDYEEGKGLCRKDYQQTFRRFDQLKRDWLIAFDDSPLPSTSENRYIFGNTIKTDGFELQIVALDMDTRSTKTKLAKNNDYLTAQATIIRKKKYKDRGVLPVDVENNLDNYVLCGIDFNQVWFGAYSEIPETTDSPMVHNQIHFKMKALKEPTNKQLFYLKNRKDAYSMDPINLVRTYQNVDFNDCEYYRVLFVILAIIEINILICSYEIYRIH